jgi:hypothetical protein
MKTLRSLLFLACMLGLPGLLRAQTATLFTVEENGEAVFDLRERQPEYVHMAAGQKSLDFEVDLRLAGDVRIVFFDHDEACDMAVGPCGLGRRRRRKGQGGRRRRQGQGGRQGRGPERAAPGAERLHVLFKGDAHPDRDRRAVDG